MFNRWREKLKRFRERYSVDNLLTLFTQFIQSLMGSALNSGNIFLQILMLPILIVLIVLVRLLRGLKWLIGNAFEQLVNTVNFVISLIARYFSEISFYWRLLAAVSALTNLALRYLIAKMLESLLFQLRQLADDQTVLTTKYEKSYLAVSWDLVIRLVAWLWILLLAVVMSAGVLVLVLLPISIFVRRYYEQGQWLREDFYTQFYSQRTIFLREEDVLGVSSSSQNSAKRYVSTIVFLLIVTTAVGGYYAYSWYYPSANSLLERGNKAFDTGDYTQALQHYERALSVKSDFGEAVTKRNQVLEKLGIQVFRDTLKDGSLGPEMVQLPAGTFQMGSNEYDGEKPVHTVSVKSFALGKYEVTFEEYDKFCDATGQSKPDDKGWGWGRGKRPVIKVSWDDAKAYAKWLSEQTGKDYRLPTEVQWEYACRAGSAGKYSFGDDVNQLGNYGWYDKNSGSQTHLVGEKQPNKFGLYDMHGNVWEWLEDVWHENYTGAPEDGSAWIAKGTANKHVIHGGAWSNHVDSLRCASRGEFDMAVRNYYLGIRLSRM